MFQGTGSPSYSCQAASCVSLLSPWHLHLPHTHTPHSELPLTGALPLLWSPDFLCPYVSGPPPPGFSPPPATHHPGTSCRQECVLYLFLFSLEQQFFHACSFICVLGIVCFFWSPLDASSTKAVSVPLCTSSLNHPDHHDSGVGK